MQKFKAAAYCRLSHEDINRQSESIENQRLIIEDYIKRHSDEFILTHTYTDDGISGMTYERAAFLKMMKDMENGYINAIIVKDLSRIGREQIETLNLIKREFILKNIRFVAITDNYDSFNPDKSDGLSTSVKLLLNDYYCADISKKIRSSQRVKMSKGDFIGSYAPYGYIKDPQNKNRLIVDREAAQIVQRIFRLYIGGMGKLTIARTLNSEGIPNPTLYKMQIQGLNYVNPNQCGQTGLWSYSTIHKILNNPVYTGDTVQHKSEIIAYNLHKKVSVPSEEWLIVHNTHPAIITPTDFETTRELLKTKGRTLDFSENHSKYSGLLFCRECGHAMNKCLSKPRNDGSRYISFKCGTYSRLGKDICTIHSIKEKDLDEILLREINNNLKYALDESICDLIKTQSSQFKHNSQSRQLEELKDNIEKCRQKHKKMLALLADGIITSHDYITFNTENNERLAVLTRRLSSMENQQQAETESPLEKWLSQLLQHKSIAYINREIIVGLIDKIYISEKNSEKSIEIHFKFKNPVA